MKRARWCVALAALALLGPTGPAHADGDAGHDRALLHLKAARSLTERDDVAGAAAQARAALKSLGVEARSRAARCEALKLLQNGASLSDDERTELEACAAAPVPRPSALRPSSSSLVTTPFSFGGRAADLARVGRFADAATLLRADHGPPDAVLLLELFDHAQAVLERAPETSARDLSMALSPSIPTVAPALALIVTASRDGRVYEAARTASTLAATVEASVAALVLRLPGALLHRQLADDALRHLVDGDGGGALERALAARRLTPASPQSAELLGQVTSSRRAALARRATELEDAAKPIVAWVYWRALQASGDDSPRVQQRVDRTWPAVRAATTLRVSLVESGTSKQAARYHQAVRAALAQALPTGMKLVKAGEVADVVVESALVGPRKQVQARIVERTVSRVAFSLPVPNPAWDDAADAYNVAIDEVAAAREQYAILHQGAQQMVGQAGGDPMGLVAGFLAAAEEAAGVALVVAAENGLKAAGAKLRATSHTVLEEQRLDEPYPVVKVHVTQSLEQSWRFRLGDQPPAERIHLLTTSVDLEAVPGSPELDVSPKRLGPAEAAVAEPDAVASAADVGREIAVALRLADAARLYSTAERLAARGEATQAAVAYALYLARVTASGDARAEAARRHLAWRLP